MLPSVPPQMSVRCFYLPITKTWLFQLILGLILVCHCSYRGVVELLRDLFDLPISVGTIRLQSAADKAAAINLTKTCLQSEWDCRTKYSRKSTSVGGVDAKSTYCYLLAAEHRDEDTWGCIYWMLASKVYPLTTPLLTLRKDSELGKQQLGRRHPVMEIFSHPASRQELVSFLSRRAATANSRRQSRDAQS